jgi:predicted N-acetyltransferase YhbS
MGDMLDIGSGQDGHRLDDTGPARYDRQMQLPLIRPMTPGDVDSIVAGFLREGWGDRRSTLDFVAVHRASRPFVAVANGDVVGTGVASVNGSVGWIGTVWVDPAWRRRGLGMALTQATIDAAEAAGCRTLVLVATAAGRRLYERIGFTVQSTYRILEASGTASGVIDPRIRPFHKADLAAMGRLANLATGEDRTHLLRAFATPQTARCLDHPDGSLGGFTVRAPWGGGHTIAPGLADGIAILESRRAVRGPNERVRAGLVEENETGLERLLEAGWTDAWRAPRMIRGEALNWQPTFIWGQFNFAMG